MTRTPATRLLSLVLGLTMIFGLAACSASGSEQEALFEPGTYTASARGHNGDVTLEVKFDETSIVDIRVVEHNESPGISDIAFERVPSAILEGQTLAVDTVAGATISSAAILAAVEDAVAQAGGDVEALKGNN